MLRFRGSSAFIILKKKSYNYTKYCWKGGQLQREPEPKSFEPNCVITCHKLRLSDGLTEGRGSVWLQFDLGSVSLKRLIAKNIISPLNASRSRSQSISSYFLLVQYLFLCQLQCPLISAVEENGEGEVEEAQQQLELLSAATTEIYGRHIKRIISKRMRHKRVPD